MPAPVSLVALVPCIYAGVAPLTRTRTALSAMIPKEQMDPKQLELEEIRAKWSEVRHLSKEEAADLEPEWQEAHTRFYEKYDADMEKMTEIATKIKKLIEPPKVERKTKGQRKRDAWAKVQAREAARAAASK